MSVSSSQSLSRLEDAVASRGPAEPGFRHQDRTVLSNSQMQAIEVQQVIGPSQESGVFTAAADVCIAGENSFTSAGGSIVNVNPAINLSIRSDPSTTLESRLHEVGSRFEAAGSDLPDLWLEREAEHDSEVYARLLLPKRLGWPLWVPRPLSNLPESYKRVGVSIGDVGAITVDGEFDFLFNICLSSEDPINLNRVPVGFRPIEPAIDYAQDVNTDSECWGAGDFVMNGSLREVRASSHASNEADGWFAFEGSASEGAILMFPYGGSRHNLMTTADFFDFAGQNAKRWYEFINTSRRCGGFGRSVANGSLYLVTGVDKTSSWGTGAFSGVKGRGTFPLTFRKSGPGVSQTKCAYSWSASGFAATKQGPAFDPSNPESDRLQNQCTFIRGFRLALPEGVWASLFGQVEVSPIHDSNSASLLSRNNYVPFGSGSRGVSRYFGRAQSRENVPSSGDVGHPYNQLANDGNAGNHPSRSLNPLSTYPQSTHGMNHDNNADEGTGGAGPSALVFHDGWTPTNILHPSDVLNNFLLAQHNEASIAITHDDVWCSAMHEGLACQPSPQDLLDLVLRKYDSVIVNGIAQFCSSEIGITKEMTECPSLSGQLSPRPVTTDAVIEETHCSANAKPADLAEEPQAFRGQGSVKRPRGVSPIPEAFTFDSDDPDFYVTNRKRRKMECFEEESHRKHLEREEEPENVKVLRNNTIHLRPPAMLSESSYDNPSLSRTSMDIEEEKALNPHGVKRQRSGFVAAGYNHEPGFVSVSGDYPAEKLNHRPVPSTSTSQLKTQETAQAAKNNGEGKGRLRLRQALVITRRVYVSNAFQCDRVFPCQSCVKRGCGSLCPEGAPTSGRGSRFILANTEQLHEKITTLSDRVRDLEEALAAVQTKVSNESHPLLNTDLLRIKTSEHLYGATQPPQLPSVPPPAISQPPYRPIGSTSPPSGEKLLPQKPQNTSTTRTKPGPPEVPKDVLQLSATFPFPWAVDLRIRQSIREALPPQEEALATCEQAQKNALWQYHIDASEMFLQNLIHHVYHSDIEDLRPRRLALLLMILSVGSIADLRKPIGNLYGEAYHHLARAAVCEIPLMEEPDFDVLHTLFYMIWWHLIFSDNRKAVGYAWNLMGFVAKLAQGLGLHRDSPRLRGLPEEDERRRAIFWELLNIDARMSLSLGRPPSLCLSHVDVRTPSFHGPGLYVPRQEALYHDWKHKFFIHCLTPVLGAIVNTNTPLTYANVLDLDNEVRDFEVPDVLRDRRHRSQDEPPFLAMQRAMVASSREIALLQLHRRFFTEAMNSVDALDINYPYAPSVLATYLGAATLTDALDILFSKEPQLSARFFYLWINAYSAAVALSLIVFRAPLTPLANSAAFELEKVCHLFNKASTVLPASGQILPLVEKLSKKAHACLKLHRSSPSQDQYQGSNAYLRVLAPGEQPRLPASFHNVHRTLLRFAEEMKSSATSMTLPPTPVPTHMPSRDYLSVQESWLPDVYKYGSTKPTPGSSSNSQAPRGLPSPHRSQPQPLPTAQQLHADRQKLFVPNSPRVDGKEEFNLDYGALAEQPEGTSYMAWF